LVCYIRKYVIIFGGIFPLTSPQPKYWGGCVPGIPGGVDASELIHPLNYKSFTKHKSTCLCGHLADQQSIYIPASGFAWHTWIQSIPGTVDVSKARSIWHHSLHTSVYHALISCLCKHVQSWSRKAAFSCTTNVNKLL